MHLKKLLIACSLLTCCITSPAAEVTTISMAFTDETHAAALATGQLYEDRNNNGRYDRPHDVPVAGVGVTDGDNVVKSEADGRYVLPLSGESKLVWICQPP